MKDYNKMYTDLFNELVVKDNDENEKEVEDLKEQLKKSYEVKSQICKNINITFMFYNKYNEELFNPYISIEGKKGEVIIYLKDLNQDTILKISLLIKNIKKEHKKDIMEIGDVFTIFYNFLKNTKNVKNFNFYYFY